MLLFSAYILYDVSRIVNGGETNYVMATMGLFLNIYNIFISLLNLLLAFTGIGSDVTAPATARRRKGGLRAALFLCRTPQRENSAIDSTCAVCGNMLTTPAASRR